MSDGKENNVVPLQTTAVGYKRPPVHSRFKPGQSGNPSGRAKVARTSRRCSQDPEEQISLREGVDLRKITKAEVACPLRAIRPAAEDRGQKPIGRGDEHHDFPATRRF